VCSGQWKKVAVAEFEVLSRNLPSEAEKKRQEKHQHRRSPGWDLNPEPSLTGLHTN
jgi:hypothetical protein